MSQVLFHGTKAAVIPFGTSQLTSGKGTRHKTARKASVLLAERQVASLTEKVRTLGRSELELLLSMATKLTRQSK
jgi:hypothetical protein